MRPYCYRGIIMCLCSPLNQYTIEHPASIQFYAWQLSQITDTFDQKISEAINHLAAETIKITDNWKPLKTYWKKTGDKLYLFLTN